MTNSERDTVIAVVADILGRDAAELDDRSGMDVTPGWDSLQHLSILLAIEEELGIRVEPDAMSKHKTVGSIVELVRSLREGA